MEIKLLFYLCLFLRPSYHNLYRTSGPSSELSFQIIEVFESVLFIELLLIFTVTSFNSTILSGFTRINEIVYDVVCSTELIKSVHLSWRKIFSFVAAVVSIGKCGVVICFDGVNGVFKFIHDNPV